MQDDGFRPHVLGQRYRLPQQYSRQGPFVGIRRDEIVELRASARSSYRHGGVGVDGVDEWTLLVSLNSFSAANTFTSVFKEMNLGKIYGNKSGGGMCSVLPLVLADGTAIAISSNNTARFVSERNNTLYFQAIEHGIEPDVEINYEDYYNDSKLVQYLNSN